MAHTQRTTRTTPALHVMRSKWATLLDDLANAPALPPVSAPVQVPGATDIITEERQYANERTARRSRG
jgi:hypothetical protein